MRVTYHLVVVSGGDAEDAGADGGVEGDDGGVGRGQEAGCEGIADDRNVHCRCVRPLRVRLVTHQHLKLDTNHGSQKKAKKKEEEEKNSELRTLLLKDRAVSYTHLTLPTTAEV